MTFLQDLDLQGKKVLYRVDINCAIEEGKLQDDTRIREIIPTLQYLMKAGVKQVIILAHQGRGKERGPETVLDLHAKRLSELMEQEVLKLDACRGVDIPEQARLVMLENVRLDDEADEDEAKRVAFAKELAQLGEVYVNDAFAACHRDHATISSLPELMKEKAAGLLLQKEIESLKPLLEGEIEHPFVLVTGGAKVDTKIGVIEQFFDKADVFLIGGAIANTFLLAEGYDVGASLKEADKVETARTIALELDKRGKTLLLPEDVVCADELVEGAPAIDVPVEDVMGDMKIVDIGRRSGEDFAQLIRTAKTVVWNGPMGLTDISSFRVGTEVVAKAMVDCKGTTIIGGGESVGVINMLGIPHHKFTHVSTGGGAMLEYLSGKALPGIEALG